MPPARKTNRRDFLSGSSAREALADLILPEPDDLSSTAGRDGHLLTVSRRAMACEFEVYLPASRAAAAMEPALAALDLVDQLEDQLTVYRDHSEISRLNRQAAEKDVRLEPQLFQLLRLAVELHGRTEGAFDITAGPLTRVWGFHRRQGRMPDQRSVEQALHCVGSQHLTLDEQQCSARFQRAGLEVNLGAIGKGYALDRCVELMTNADARDFLIHGGASSVSARGNRITDGNPPTPWTVALRHPLRRDVRLGEIVLRNEAIGTSGTANQFFHHRGRRYGHVLDPRTGQPAEGVLSATVWAPTAALADALATAFFVMGPEAAERFCQQGGPNQGMAALLVVPAKPSGAVEVRCLGSFDQDRWRPATKH